jgi:hypothetical protein
MRLLSSSSDGTEINEVSPKYIRRIFSKRWKSAFRVPAFAASISIGVVVANSFKNARSNFGLSNVWLVNG